MTKVCWASDLLISQDIPPGVQSWLIWVSTDSEANNYRFVGSDSLDSLDSNSIYSLFLNVSSFLLVFFSLNAIQTEMDIHFLLTIRPKNSTDFCRPFHSIHSFISGLE